MTVSGNTICGNGAPSALDVTVTPKPETPVVDSNGFVLTSSASTGNQWYRDGVLIPGATGQQYTVTENGFYWTVVTINGCSSDESNHVYILITGSERQKPRYARFTRFQTMDGSRSLLRLHQGIPAHRGL